MATSTRSTCCYCGVGCGVLIDADGDRITGIRGDPAHPANFGRLCSKGMRLPDTAASLTGRALYPQVRPARGTARQRADWNSALGTIADRLADIIERDGPDAVAFYVSGQLLTEDYYVFNKLAKGLIGTNNIDTNSRLCMSSAVTAYKQAFGADGPPGCYEDLEQADCVLFAGSNAAHAHPVLFRRLETIRAARPDTRWIVIDPRRTDTAAMADLHLQIRPGTDVALFNGMLHHLIWEGLTDTRYLAAHTDGFAALKSCLRDNTPSVAAGICGIAEADLIQAAEWFARSPASLSLYCMGLNQSIHGTDKNLALINLHLATGQIGRPGTGPFSLTGQPNAMGGREVGGMATMLAAHRDLDNPAHRADVARQWQIDPARLSDRPGLPAVALFDAVRAGQVKAIWIVCTNPAHSMPDLGNVRAALEQAEFVVVQEAFADTDTTPFADVLLPAATWGEKDGTVTNSERRISRVRAAVVAPGEARPDWWIAAEAGRRLEARLRPGAASLFPFANSAAVFDEHARLTVGRDLDIGGLDHARLDRDGPQQWPLPAGARTGQARLYADGRFATDDGRARFHATPYLPVAEPASARYPFQLLTGRLRDQWHGMSRSGRTPQSFASAPDPCLQMHPGDAGRRGLENGQLVRIISARGALVLPLALSDQVASGNVFAAMHWNGQYLNSSGINEVCSPRVDTLSQQPELKHAAVRIEPAMLPWRVVAACRADDVLALQAAVQPLLKACGYAAISLLGEDTLVLRAAGAEAADDWLAALFDALGLHPGAEVLDYRDSRRGIVKRIGWHGNALSGFLLAGDTGGAERLLDSLLAGTAWQGSRLAAFSPAADSTPRDRIICSCARIGEARIRAQLERGASVDELKTTLGCGAICGSCVPELKRLRADVPQPA